MWMNSTIGLVAGLLFVGLALCSVLLMLEEGRSQSLSTKTRLIVLHRVSGYSYLILFSLVTYFMSQRLVGTGLSKKLLTDLVLHVALALLLVPLVVVKVLVARRYKHAHSVLMPLGISIFIVSALLVAIPSFSEYLRSTHPGSLGLRITVAIAIATCVSLCGSKLRSLIKPSLPSSSEEPRLTTLIPKTTSAQDATTPMTLLLTRIVEETHDTKTLRFLVPRERRFKARPGQFLTFHWIIRGQRVLRSYTISSSSLHTEYVEITPKRVENGCVSSFLHADAKLGLLVEATGPYGHFCFDETTHENIVLLAAGVGITPMMAILRYIRDRDLSTRVALLYCVRTRADIIFEEELGRLKHRLPNFNYSVCLSRPDERWHGYSGHLNEKLIVDQSVGFSSPTFFVCGPPAFMHSARQILTSLSVSDDRIKQESFGEKRATVRPTQVQTTVYVEFAVSKKVCQVPVGSNLLEVAERNGVQIPFGCRRGQCGTCATRVLHGVVEMETDVGLPSDQKRSGYVLACVSHADGHVVLER
jgi:glycine betaine catabolism B